MRRAKYRRGLATRSALKIGAPSTDPEKPSSILTVWALKTTIPRSRVSRRARSCGCPRARTPRPAALQVSRSRGILLSRKSSPAPSQPFPSKRARPSCCPRWLHRPRLQGSLGSRRPSDATTSSRGSDSDTTTSLPPLPELPPPHLRHSSRARVTPLTQLPQRLHPAAAMLSRNLLAAMGDRKLSFPDRLASTVSACALASPGYDDS